jgi:hypothetical protein
VLVEKKRHEVSFAGSWLEGIWGTGGHRSGEWMVADKEGIGGSKRGWREKERGWREKERGWATDEFGI